MTGDPAELFRERRLVVFDLDGTLYAQGSVRRAMLWELLTIGGDPGRIERLRVLRRFRELREEFGDTSPEKFDAPLFDRLSSETGLSVEALRTLTDEWMGERPLRHLSKGRIAGVSELFAALRAAGTRVVVWSDHPARAKLAALGLEADEVISATDADLDTLKPHPAGLRKALGGAGCEPDQALMVGDRMERDGAAASLIGVPFLLRAAKGPADVPRMADFGAAARALS